MLEKLTIYNKNKTHHIRKFNLKVRFITAFYTDTSKREENSVIAVTSAVCFNK